ncbi:hypothetical protein ACS0TY_031698 [Phlomoides rotata]
MEQDLLKFLPSDIIIDFLSRLPVRTIIYCKCVCKSWLSLIKTHEFVKLHLSKSVPGLIVGHLELGMYEIYEFEDRPELEHHELHNPLTKFKFPHHHYSSMFGTADGLILLLGINPNRHYICNPVTRDYIILDISQEYINKHLVTIGFGVSKITGQHKVVGVIHGYTTDQERRAICECHVYTLETGSWRTTAGPLLYGGARMGSFLFGNLHWLEFKNDTPWISCFDLETEIFSTFSCARPLLGSGIFLLSLVALGDFLCLCDNTSSDDIVIWLMKEYGIEKSWTKEFVIRKTPTLFNNRSIVYPIKVFKDGDILMSWNDTFLFCYSKKNNTTQIINTFDGGHFQKFLHTSSFYSLKSFFKSNVRSF